MLSVKASGSNAAVMTGPGTAASHFAPFRYNGSRVSCDLSLRAIIDEAFSLRDHQVAGPPWIASQTYRIDAVAPAGAEKSAVRLMLQTALKDRLGFRFHFEQREVSGYALIEAKGGAKLRPPGSGKAAPKLMDTPEGPRPAASFQAMTEFSAPAISLEDFADWLAHRLEVLVVDTTSLKEKYEISLKWGNGEEGERPVTPHESDAELLRQMEKQLGLKLDKRRVQVATLVIDHVEKIPTEN